MKINSLFCVWNKLGQGRYKMGVAKEGCVQENPKGYLRFYLTVHIYSFKVELLDNQYSITNSCHSPSSVTIWQNYWDILENETSETGLSFVNSGYIILRINWFVNPAIFVQSPETFC